jgi:sugar transferase (PEP-CTERM/EpsH1 system associated)
LTGALPRPPLVAHLIHRFTLGGLEHGLVNLINHMPAARYRHAIICLTGFTELSRQIARPAVPLVALEKCQGSFDPRMYARLWRALRELKPDIVHTRNLGALETQICAALARVPARVHGVHGRDMYDLYGTNRKYNLFRKGMRPLIHHYTAVSRDLAGWLVSSIHVPPSRVTQIYNGVDTVRFHPARRRDPAMFPPGFLPEGAFVIGTVGRFQAVKDQPTMARAFVRLLEICPSARQHVRLLLVGDGPLAAECRRVLQEAGAVDLAWLAGERSDVPELMRAMDLFVLPSLAEGISNTILEAMASGLPVLATRVGGSPELVEESETGALVPPSDPSAMATAMLAYVSDPDLAIRHGRAARVKAESQFSWESMVAGYMGVYDKVLSRHPAPLASYASVRE